MAVFALTRWPGLLPANFSAAYALAFCGGIYFIGPMAWWLPLVTLFITGTLLNWLYYDFPLIDGYVLLSYLAFGVLVGLGRLFRRYKSPITLIGGGLLGAILFYLITNTISWIFEPTQPYPKTPSGWLKALTIGTAGWPETWTFFRNTLLSSGLFTGLFVGAMKMSECVEKAEEPQVEEEPEGAPGEPEAQKP